MDVIVPVKCFAHAKSRLAPMFDSAVRQQLARVMTRSVLTELKQVKGLGRILVVTSEPEMMETARSLGIEALWALGAAGLNGALSHAEDKLAACAEIAIVCADLPFFRAAEFERMIVAHSELGPEAITLATDRAGTGTNVRMVRARTRFPYLYGSESAQAHALAAQKRSLKHQVFASETLALDLDTPADAIQVFRSTANNVGQPRPVRTILSSHLSEIRGDVRPWNSKKQL
jgi:2-phospho-L-lactate/phosphoenolpyruvate guanylyltransferase